MKRWFNGLVVAGLLAILAVPFEAHAYKSHVCRAMLVQTDPLCTGPGTGYTWVLVCNDGYVAGSSTSNCDRYGPSDSLAKACAAACANHGGIINKGPAPCSTPVSTTCPGSIKKSMGGSAVAAIVPPAGFAVQPERLPFGAGAYSNDTGRVAGKQLLCHYTNGLPGAAARGFNLQFKDLVGSGSLNGCTKCAFSKPTFACAK